MTPVQRHQTLTEIATSLNATFTAAAAERNRRQEWVSSGHDDHDVPGWVVHERHVMFGAVNLHRKQRGKAPLEMVDLMRAERHAIGHPTDYQRKLVWYCAELVIDAP